jgi:hypothetical protein
MEAREPASLLNMTTGHAVLAPSTLLAIAGIPLPKAVFDWRSAIKATSVSRDTSAPRRVKTPVNWLI